VKTKRHIVCYSGGHSSALVAIEVARRYPKDIVVQKNHDIPYWTETQDIKRFKTEISDYLGLPITFASYKHAQYDQFDVCVQAKAFKVGDNSELCTSRLKTEPFKKWLKDNPSDLDTIIYYGFDPNETHRIQRRSSIIASMGYRSDYPLALWKDRTIHHVSEIGIEPPNTYDMFKHANCIGCLKAGWQHWYAVYCIRPDIWELGKWAEEEIGYAIHKDKDGAVYLEEMEERFEKMKNAGVEPTEHMPHQTFWANARKVVQIHEVDDAKPCECVL
jgi:hypothetical protein